MPWCDLWPRQSLPGWRSRLLLLRQCGKSVESGWHVTDPGTNIERAHLGWRALRWLIWRSLKKTCHRHLANRSLHLASGEEVRWLTEEINRFLMILARQTKDMRTGADLPRLPDAGSRLMVELVIYTAAADAALRELGVETECAHGVVADLGWDLYRRMLAISSLGPRLLSRNPGRRLRWTIRGLLVFPFRPVGAPGYDVQVFRKGDDLHTHFTHCPPQTFARTMAGLRDDPELLEAFRRSWCRYDWPGADLIAADGVRGHYSRPLTLSAGDRVCDMCWTAKGSARISNKNMKRQ